MSDTSKTKTRRLVRKKAMGKKRKKQLEKQGSTPKFPIHPEGKKSSRSNSDDD